MSWRRQPPEFDLVLVVAPQNRGWILDAIGGEIASRHAGTSAVHYEGVLPTARAYFFTHYSLYLRARKLAPVRRAASVVFYTHPSYVEPQLGRRLGTADAVISMCTPHALALARLGVRERKIHVMIPGADPDRFLPHVRGAGAAGFCSAYYERKRPELVIELVRALPRREFRLMGRGWKETDVFAELVSEPNFTYVEDDYSNYPAFYDDIDVFVSPGRLEGGPIPLLEAMMANVVPVASDTGFARDLIDSGTNGYIVPVEATVDAYADAVEAAFAHEGDIRATVVGYTWERFAGEVLALITQLTK